MVAAGGLKHVRHELGSNRSPTLILLILASIREVGQDGGDSARRGCAAGIDEDEQLHDMIVHAGGLAGLDDEDYARSVSLALPCACITQGVHTILVAHTLAD